MKYSLIVTLLAALALPLAAQEIDFNRDIQPILNENCLDCHGPDAQESGFRIDTRVAMLAGGDYGEPGIVPGDSKKSSVLTAIEYEDDDLQMPPDGKLDEESIDLIRRWIEQGAVWPGQMEDKVVREKSDHWSFQPIRRPAPPTSESENGSNIIDAFLEEKLREKGLKFSPAADARTLIRRASIIVTGLPPTPEEVAQFEKQFANNPEQAYSKLVDHLLDSPHFGERWAQHWLDVIRWAETNGSESNMYRKNAWIYRDYVIRAFNEDKPYDQFVREQLAGDSMGMGEATGFLVAGPHVPVATVGQEPTAQRQARADRMDEVMQTLGASMMGVTIGCARCHNHKFDPISIKDYYSMTAAFQDVEFGSRFPEYSTDHPRRQRAKELWAEMAKQRNILRQTGGWIEDWEGYDEHHFHPIETKAIRLQFMYRGTRVDELEVFGKKHGNTNLIHFQQPVEVRHNEEIQNPRGEIEHINDGEYGTQGWSAKAKEGSKEKPWVEFHFDEPKSIDRLRISSNREDSLVTDYLTGINQKNFGPYRIEILTPDGKWKSITNTKAIEEKNKTTPERAAAIKEINRLARLLSEEGPKPSFIGRFVSPKETFVLRRGSPENPGDRVSPAGLTELDGQLELNKASGGRKTRAAFADWLLKEEHPLTSRVMVNRIWHHVFGQGIVTTTSDFGKAGAPPTHPELLDWLASEFQHPQTQSGAQPANDWSVKHMIRLMLLSKAFRQQSLPRETGMKMDAGSALLWRYPPKRMEAEVIRDSIVKASGTLDSTIGGRSYRIHNVKKRYAQWDVIDNFSQNTWRRLIYQERMRRVDDRNFTAFDFPDCGQIRARRPVSTTPLQALNLMNSEFVVDQSKRIAERASKETEADSQAAIKRCFQLLLNREPSTDELELSSKIVEDEGLFVVCRALINSNEFVFIP